MMTTDGGERTERQMLDELLDWCHDLSGTVEQDEEIEQVRACVDGLAAQVAALTAERDELAAQVQIVTHARDLLAGRLARVEATESQLRVALRQVLFAAHMALNDLRADEEQAATTPPAGAQEGDDATGDD